MSDKVIEEQIVEAGNRLLRPPSSAHELLPLLDKMEKCLSKVDQSPSKAIQSALNIPLKALISSEFRTHEDVDVRVAVASCINEITRITAPEAPYDDEQMKEAFKLIVWSFEGLHDKSSPSFIRRRTILESVAKVRSCVVMLDLECEGLIIEMFQHFLKSLRDYHPETIFIAMETIMSLVIEESEDVSADLLEPIFASVKKDNKDYSSISRKLSEEVLKNCAAKLKPYLIKAVKSLGIFLDDYSDVLAVICLEKSDAVKQPEPKISVGSKRDEAKTVATSDVAEVSEKKTVDNTCPEAREEKPPKMPTSNGTAENEIADSVPDSNMSKHIDNSSSMKNVKKSNKKEGNTSKKRNRKTTVASKKPPICVIEEASIPDMKTETEMKNEETHDKPKSPKVTEGEAVDTASPSPSGREAEPQSKKSGRARKRRLFDDEKTEDIKSTVKPKEPPQKVVTDDTMMSLDENSKKRGRKRPDTQKDDKESTADFESKPITEVEAAPTPMSVSKSEETPIMSTTRRHTAGKDKASESVEYGEEIVGSKVKVWWPKDRMFYEGVVDSFDPIKRKHKILYMDGDEEILNMKRQRWVPLEDKPGTDEEGADKNSDTVPEDKKQKSVGEGSSKASRSRPKSVKKSKDDKKGLDDSASKLANPVDEVPQIPVDGEVEHGGSQKDGGMDVAGSPMKSKGSSSRQGKRKFNTPKVEKVETLPESAEDSLKNAENMKAESVDPKAGETSGKSKAVGGSSRSGQKRK